MRYLLIALLLVATTANAADPWGDRLRAVFPNAKIVETFDDIKPWLPSTGAGSMVTNLPVRNDGSATPINYYTNGADNAPTSEHAIKDHGDSITGQACKLSFLPERKGLYGHLGFMFGNGSPTTGFRNMHVFWRLKFPKNVFPTSIDSSMQGHYDASAQNYAGSMLPKLASFSHGVTGQDRWNGYNEVTGTQQGPYAIGFPRMPYGTYSVVPQLQYGGSYINVPSGPQVARMTWVMNDFGTATWPNGAGYEAPDGYGRLYNWARGNVAGAYQGIATGQWIGLEFRVKLNDAAEATDEMQIWYYSPEGVKTELVNRNNCYLHNIGISAGHAWNFVFLGGNTSNTWGSMDSSMVASYLVDDVIISDAPIGDAYFAELTAYQSGDNVPVRPSIYYVDATNGNDSNDGLASNRAWQTIGKVNGVDFIPGDIIRFNSGDYGTTTLSPKTSGTADNYITFTSYAGSPNKPVLKGGVNLNGRNYVRIDDLDVTSTGITFSLSGATHNIISNNTIYSTAASWSPTISVRNGSHYNQITGNTISQAPANNDIINLRNDADNNLIANNTITVQGSHAAIDIEGWTLGGVAQVGDRSGNNNVIKGNKITGHNGGGVHITIQANSFGNVVEGNELKGDNTVGNYCYLTYPSTQYARTQALMKGVGEHNIIRNNILSNYPCQDSEGLFFDTYTYDGFTNNALNNHIYNNVITGIGSGATGIYFGVADGGTHSGNVIKNNILHNNGGLTWTRDADGAVSSATALFQMRDSLDSNFYDNNIFYTSQTNGAVIWLGNNYYSVGQADSNSTKWNNNLQVDPLLDVTTLFPGNGSPALNNGANLTTITSASTSTPSGTFTVADAYYFSDGKGITTGDVIEVNEQLATITDISYGTGTTGALTVTPPITWAQGMGVNLPFDGTAPHIGLSAAPVAIDTPPVTVATVNGVYPKTVTLSASEPAAIYYTVDGSDPVTSPTRNTYTGTPLIINVTTTLRFYAQDVAGNAETPQSVTYTITMPEEPKKPTIRAAGRAKAR